jgi:hypothetical protein
MLSIQTLGFTLSFALYEYQTSDIVANLIIIIDFHAIFGFLADLSGANFKAPLFAIVKFQISYYIEVVHRP